MRLHIAPNYAACKVMGHLKGKSALILFNRHPEWRKIAGCDRTFWIRGNFMITGGINEAVIVGRAENRRM